MVWAILRLAFKKFLRIDGTTWAGAFAFNAFFALFPLMALLGITSGAVYTPVSQRLLPLDETWRRELAELPWPMQNLPEIMGSKTDTLRALIDEELFEVISGFEALREAEN